MGVIDRARGLLGERGRVTRGRGVGRSTGTGRIGRSRREVATGRSVDRVSARGAFEGVEWR